MSVREIGGLIQAGFRSGKGVPPSRTSRLRSQPGRGGTTSRGTRRQEGFRGPAVPPGWPKPREGCRPVSRRWSGRGLSRAGLSPFVYVGRPGVLLRPRESERRGRTARGGVGRGDGGQPEMAEDLHHHLGIGEEREHGHGHVAGEDGQEEVPRLEDEVHCFHRAVGRIMDGDRYVRARGDEVYEEYRIAGDRDGFKT